MTFRQVLGMSTLGAAAVAGMLAVRRWQLRWGATGDEAGGFLPGDDIIADPDLTATRAITIDTPAGQVWPWIAQLGQGRGGFYSYDFLENLVGCDIHSANRIMPLWQDVGPGDQIRLAPQVALAVAMVEPGQSLVLRSGGPRGNTSPPYDFTWAFVLKEEPGGATRLLVRERYAFLRPWARVLVEPVAAVSFVMSQKMLRGIRDRGRTLRCCHSKPRHRTVEPATMSFIAADVRILGQGPDGYLCKTGNCSAVEPRDRALDSGTSLYRDSLPAVATAERWELSGSWITGPQAMLRQEEAEDRSQCLSVAADRRTLARVRENEPHERQHVSLDRSCLLRALHDCHLQRAGRSLRGRPPAALRC